MRLILTLLAYRHFDLIVCGHIRLQPAAALARWLTGARSILLLHGIEAWTAPAGAIGRHSVLFADHVLAVSRVTLDRFTKWSRFAPDRAAILPCAVDLERFTPGKPDEAVIARYGISWGTIVLSLGRLSSAEKYKGFDELLEVLPALRIDAPDIVCVIAGAGDDRERLQAKAQALGVGASVRFTGFVPDGDLVDLYRAARAFTLAGSGEGFGIVLLEAMACGVPVVASTLDGSFETIGCGSLGIAVDPRDAQALTSGILAALRRPVGRRPDGIEGFSYEAFANRVHAQLAGLIAPGMHRDAKASPFGEADHRPGRRERL